MPKKKYPFGEKIVRNLYLLRANDEYKMEMKKLEKKYNPPANDEIIDGKEELEFLQSPQFMEYTKAVLETLGKYNIEVIIVYLVSYLAEKGYLAEIVNGGKVKLDLEEMKEYLFSKSGIQIIENSKAGLTINMQPGTTNKDFQKFVSENKDVLDKKGTRVKYSKNEERDYEVLRLHIAGKKASEIAHIINADPRFKNKKKIYYQDVPVIIKRLKDKAKSITHKDS